MTSPNAPILNKILSELTEMKLDIRELKTDMAEVKLRVGRLEEDVGILKSNDIKLNFTVGQLQENILFIRKNTSIIQEKSDAEFFRKHLDKDFPTLNLKIHKFGTFYNMTGDPITDIDGCVTADTVSIRPPTSVLLRNIYNNALLPTSSKTMTTVSMKKNNSGNNKIVRNAVFFIESKNLFDKVKFDNKIQQYTLILSMIKTLKLVDKTNVHQNFRDMLESSVLTRFPSEVFFIFSANDLPTHLRNFIELINTNELTEENYKSTVVEMFKEHDMYYTILKLIKTKPYLKRKYLAAITFDDYISVFNDSVFLKNPEYSKHAVFLKSFFIDYNSVKKLYSSVCGLIGYIFHQEVYMPLAF